jgi:hypothetical protein
MQAIIIAGKIVNVDFQGISILDITDSAMDYFNTDRYFTALSNLCDYAAHGHFKAAQDVNKDDIVALLPLLDYIGAPTDTMKGWKGIIDEGGRIFRTMESALVMLYLRITKPEDFSYDINYAITDTMLDPLYRDLVANHFGAIDVSALLMCEVTHPLHFTPAWEMTNAAANAPCGNEAAFLKKLVEAVPAVENILGLLSDRVIIAGGIAADIMCSDRYSSSSDVDIFVLGDVLLWQRVRTVMGAALGYPPTTAKADAHIQLRRDPDNPSS